MSIFHFITCVFNNIIFLTCRYCLPSGEDLMLLQRLKHLMVDFIVHGIGGPYTNCDIFSIFDPRKKMLIEFHDDLNKLKDYSLSRCVSHDESFQGFHPDGFHVVLPTPGTPNSCDQKPLINQVYHLFDCEGTTLEMAPLENVDADEKCKVFINELNTGSPGVVHKMDFIELSVFDCPKKSKSTSFQGYKLIGISAGSGRSDGMLIDLVVNLWNANWNPNKFFTIGTEDVSNADLTTDSPYVTYRNKYSGSTKDNALFMLTGNRHLHAIALLYKHSNNFNELTLSAKKPYIIIDDKLKDLIKKNLVDLVVYGRKAPYDNCVLFTDLYNEYTNMDYILREFDNNQEGLDRTLNRCTVVSTNGFVPEHFKLGAPTPGAENDCTGPHFIIERLLPNISNPFEVSPFDSDNFDSNFDSLMQDDSAQCSTSTDLSTYASTSVAALNAEIDKEHTLAQSDTCSALNLGSDDGNIGEELEVSNSRKRRLSETTDYSEELEWETTAHFQ